MTTIAMLPPSIQDALDRARERVESELTTNARLRWLVAAGALALYIGVLLTAWNDVNASRANLHQTQDRLARLEAQASETRWPDRAQQAQALANALEQRLWAGDTPGLAEAGFERWIRQGLEEQGVDIRQVQLSRGPALDNRNDAAGASLADVQRIRAKVVGELNEAALIRFLSAASENQSWIFVEQLIIRGGRNARFEMDLAVFYRPGAARS